MNVRPRTDNQEVIKAWDCPDAELQSMNAILPRIPLSSRSDFKECIRLHAEYIESGLVGIPWEYQESLQSVDPYLRLRWDMQCMCYVIERIDTSLRAWVRLFRWAHEDGSAKRLSHEAMHEMKLKLHSADMRQADSPEEYLQAKRDRAAKVRADHDNRNTEELRDAVDRMTGKQIDEFVAAEKAIVAGERIHVRGDDAKKLNSWYEMGRAGVGIPDSAHAINPGAAPVR